MICGRENQENTVSNTGMVGGFLVSAGEWMRGEGFQVSVKNNATSNLFFQM